MERPANMTPNGMPPQGANMNSMQRPQPGNPQQQIHAQIMTNLRGKMSQLPPGWQSTFDIGQRAQAIMQLVSNLRILESSIEKCISIAASFEERLLNESPSREVYMQRLAGKLQDIKAKREQQMQNMQFAPGQMNMQMNNGMGMQQGNVGMANLNMMQNNGMGGIGMGMNMPPNQGMNNFGGNAGQQNQGFPAQLQRPMQASPLPPQQQQGQSSNGTLDPSTLQNNQMTNFGQANQQPQQNVNMNSSGQNQQANQQQQQILAMVRQMMNQTPEDKKQLLRQQFLAQLDDQKKQQLMAQKRDPLQTYFTMQASEMLRKRAQQAGQASQPQQGNAMQMGGVPMQQSASQSSSAPQFDFTSMLGQQANAIKSQESGEQVVPASNNNNNGGLGLGGGQMNMSQGVNPQAVTNQNGQVNNNAQLQQLLAAQQEKARRDQMQQQNQTAQNQAMSQQQAQQLRGQPGGLNAQNAFGNGQVNSPAMNNMNMLNRPMAPPGGQPAPSTPQQPRPGMAQTPMNPANQLAQHHQTMLNQNNQQNQQNQGVQGMRSRDQLINSLPPAVREKLAPLTPQQVDAVLARYLQQNTNANHQQGANMGNRPMNGAQAPLSGIPGNMGSAVPTFNSQPNQQPGRQGSNEQLQQRLQQHQTNQLRQRALDLMSLPKAVLPSLSLAVPDSVNTWGKLKQHITQNQAVLPPNILQKLHNTQQQYYEQRPDEVKQAVHSFAQQMQQVQQMRQAQQGQVNQQQQQQQQPAARPPSSMAMPNGQAPQAQMVPPAMQQPNQPGLNANANQQQQQQIRIPPVQPPTIQEIQAFRQQIPHAQNISDEQVRNHIMQRKAQQANALAIQAQQQQNLRNQMQRAQALTGGQQNNVGQQASAGQGNQAAQPPRQQPQPPAKQQANNQAQGQKRQQSDDVVEIPKPVAQAQTAQANQSQQLPPGVPRMPSREEFLKLPLEQQQLLQQRVRQMEALRKAQTSGQQASQAQAQGQPQPQQQQQQQQPNQPTTQNELQQRLRAIYAEVAAANPKGPSVQLDAKSLEQAKAMLKKLYPAVQTLGTTLSMAMRAPNFGEQRVREAIRNLVLVQNNAENANGDVKDYLSLNIADLRQIELFIARYFSDMKALKAQAQAANGAQTEQQQARPQQQPAAKTQEQPATKPPQAARKASAANTKAPPAPTENKTFDWGSPSPHGVPKYEGVAGGLTSDKLKLPANKKRKTNQAESQDSKAASQASVSGAGSAKSVESKTQSQEQAAKTQPSQAMQKAPEPEKAKWKCDDTFCDASVNGFETEAQLKEHKETAHQPITDPMNFMLENAAKYFSVDQDGNPLADKKDAKAGILSKPANKKELPGSKRDSATPASNGKATAKPSSDKPVVSAPEAPKKEQTLMERMCENIGFELPVKKEEPTPPKNSNEAAEDDSWLFNLSNEMDEEVDAFGGRIGWLPSEADWAALPKGTYRYSPEPTPSSDETSQSSHASDISMNEKLRINFEWDAFGNGDTYVPEILRLNKLGLSPGEKTAGDVAMLGGDGQRKSDDAQKKDDPWDWSEDVIDYDAFFDNGNDKLFDASEAF